MNNDEIIEFEDRAYINPTLSSGEQEAFINSLRDVQNQNNAQIAEQTENLGTTVPSNLGGLGGGEAYFTSRYQTPQVGEMVATLKSAAQAQALNDVMKNYQAQLQNQYKQAYRNAQKRSAARQRAYYNSLTGGGTGSGGGTGNGNTSGWNGDIDLVDGKTSSGTGSIIGDMNEWLFGKLRDKAASGAAINEPPKMSDYQITGEQQTQRVSGGTGLPEWLVNTLKIFG